MWGSKRQFNKKQNPNPYQDRQGSETLGRCNSESRDLASPLEFERPSCENSTGSLFRELPPPTGSLKSTGPPHPPQPAPVYLIFRRGYLRTACRKLRDLPTELFCLLLTERANLFPCFFFFFLLTETLKEHRTVWRNASQLASVHDCIGLSFKIQDCRSSTCHRQTAYPSILSLALASTSVSSKLILPSIRWNHSPERVGVRALRGPGSLNGSCSLCHDNNCHLGMHLPDSTDPHNRHLWTINPQR